MRKTCKHGNKMLPEIRYWLHRYIPLIKPQGECLK